MYRQGGASPARAGGLRGAEGAPADLDTQLEDLLHAVWLGEENWRFDDRLELALRRHVGGAAS